MKLEQISDKSDEQGLKCKKHLAQKCQRLEALSRTISCIGLYILSIQDAATQIKNEHYGGTVHLSPSVVTVTRTKDWTYPSLSFS